MLWVPGVWRGGCPGRGPKAGLASGGSDNARRPPAPPAGDKQGWPGRRSATGDRTCRHATPRPANGHGKAAPPGPAGEPGAGPACGDARAKRREEQGAGLAPSGAA